ncbi:hypothetical protein I6F11_28985 [Ensifer sp. NBAIM29]|nr:hypothetical protein [Ensifer sp. NBAIM29]
MSERASAILFADAAGAILVASGPDRQRGLLSAELVSGGNRLRQWSVDRRTGDGGSLEGGH